MSILSYTQPLPYDNLIDQSYPLRTKTGTITTGTLTAGAVLGRINTSVGTPAYSANNTGNGTIGSISLGAQATGGVYNLNCNTVATSATTAKFTLTDPLGNVISTAIATGSQQTTTHLVFTITAGGTAFAIGDVITVPVLAGNYKLAASAANDGSATPVAILLTDADASSASVESLILVAGAVNARRLSFGTGHSAGTVEDALRIRGIHLVTVSL
jgi:hypothetical protein